MSNHNNEQIKKHIQSSQELLAKLDGLEDTLSIQLHKGFEDNLGIPIPSAIIADVLKVDSAMKYSTELKIDEFVSGALSIATAAFSGDDAEVATKAVQIASDAIKQIFGSGSVQVGFQGSSAKITRNGKVHVAACFASTAFCSQQQWATQTDFYVAKYVFVIFEVKQPKARILQKLPSI